MRFIRNLLILTLLAFGSFYVLEQNNMSPEEAIDNISNVVKKKKSELETKVAPEKEQINMPLEGSLFQWIGKSPEELIQTMGEPQRKDRSAYGYTWWVYTDQTSQYIQFGMEDNEIITIYATGNELKTEPLQIGQSYDSVSQQLSFTDEVEYSQSLSSYTFNLKMEDMETRPLAKLTEDIFLQAYFDTFTNKLSSIRILTGETLLKHRPYDLEYRGSLPNDPHLTDNEWSEVEDGVEQQVFDITNVMRNQHGKAILNWQETVSEVAYGHSKDMAENNYFSHYGLNGEGLKERLSVVDVLYTAAGENIAAQYVDAPAAMEGWLNSEGHREALLEDEYTHLGVGVYRLYYTQNFLEKP
ncbi:CAP domain-containing protein [Virgibacillus ainsalahensis]